MTTGDGGLGGDLLLPNVLVRRRAVAGCVGGILVPRREEPFVESWEERLRRDEQTGRNLAGLEAEQGGRLEEAIALYEQNAAEGFVGDWPYGRLVAIYEKRGSFDDAERVLVRAIEVIAASRTRTPGVRRSLVATFRKRLMLTRKLRRAAQQK